MSHIACSVIIKTKNEARSIRRCLASVSDFDELIVVDSNSEDETQAIATAQGARVVPFTWNGKYPKKVEWSYQNVAPRNDWVLLLDGDEFVSARLRTEISDLIAEAPPEVHAAEISLNYHFAGRQLKYGHRVWKRVLIRASVATWPRPDDLNIPGMGELEGHYQPLVSGRVVRLRERLDHDDEDPLFDYFNRHNKYSDWEAGLRTSTSREEARRARTSGGRAFAQIPLKPLAFFIYSYIFKRGFLDGRAGFDYAMSNSFYYWQIGLKARDLSRRTPLGTSRPNKPKSIHEGRSAGT